jgi:hypothetical protein
VFVGGTKGIDLIERQLDKKFKVNWRQTKDIYSTGTTPSQIFMGKSSNYLVLKQKDDPTLKIIAACSPFTFFNKITYSCDPCESMTRSWGV